MFIDGHNRLFLREAATLKVIEENTMNPLYRICHGHMAQWLDMHDLLVYV